MSVYESCGSNSGYGSDHFSVYESCGGNRGCIVTISVCDVAAGSMSEDFAQKMHAWHELQFRKSSSFKSEYFSGVPQRAPSVKAVNPLPPQSLFLRPAAETLDCCKVFAVSHSCW